MEEVTEHRIAGIQSLAESPTTADHALEVAPRLGTVVPVPFAVYILYCARAAGWRPDGIYLANLLHMHGKAQLYPENPNLVLSVKYRALPTTGKSPAYNLVTKLHTETLKFLL